MVSPISRGARRQPKDSFSNTTRENSDTLTLMEVTSPMILEARGEGGSETENHSEMETKKLRPCDGGKHAWLYLIGASVIEGLIWGNYQVLSLPSSATSCEISFDL